jgi:hypothetical protein
MTTIQRLHQPDDPTTPAPGAHHTPAISRSVDPGLDERSVRPGIY